MKPGTILGDQYEVGEPLGEGGVGVIYRAHDTKLDRPVAIKTLSPHLHFDDEARRRFIQEAQAASALDHPHICRIHDIVDTPDGRVYVVMQYYEGSTLKKRITSGPFTVEEVLDIGAQLASALETAHEAGIIHRDLKPSNVQITERGEAKLLDFGIAKLSAGEGMTQPGVPIGTVGYASPEQLEAVSVDHRTDLWALGVVLYEMLTGANPFNRRTPIATTSAVLRDEPEPLSEIRPDAPVALAEVIEACLAKKPADRPSDAATIRRALDEALSAAIAGPVVPPASVRHAGAGVATGKGLLIAAVIAGMGGVVAWLLLR